MSELLLTAAQAADVLGLSADSVYSLVRRHIFPPGVLVMVTPKRGIRFHRAALALWIEAGGIAGPSQETDQVENSARVHP